MNQLEPTLDISRAHRFTGLMNKKKLFEKLAELLTLESGPSFHRVLDGLNAREKLGCTCIGKGVAIPHCKLSSDTPVAAVMILDEPIKYGENDDNIVDIIFGLMVPVENCEQHLHLLSSIAKLCEQESWLDGLRCLKSDQEITAYLAATETSLGEFL